MTNRLLVVLALLASCAMTSRAQSPVRYEIAFPNRVHHEAEVTMTLQDLPDAPIRIRMSRSSPGRYALHEFAKNVYELAAVDGRGRSLTVTRPDPYSWTIPTHDGTVSVTYTLFADRADGTYSGIDNTHAHLNMPATFIWAEGLERRPIEVAFRRPDPTWRIATQLVPSDDEELFSAPNLYYFMDSPTEVSPHVLRSWTETDGDGSTYTIRLALHHDGTDAEADAYARMAEQVVAEQIAVWQDVPDFDYGTYTFLACYLPWVSGDGMEHRNSTILTSTGSLAENALGLLGTVSHEFFHAWNVERLRPRSLEPFDFTEANMSDALWFAEGFTSYYDDLTIHRAGLTGLEEYAHGLTGQFNYVLRSPGSRYFTPVEMSRQAPFVDAAASIDPVNRANTFISYYSWGAMIGLGLDLTLRSRFGLPLDGYLRLLWEAYGKDEIPYTLAGLEMTLAEYTNDPDFARAFFARYVYGHEFVPYADLLAEAGIVLQQANPRAPFIGSVRFEAVEGGVRVDGVTRVGSPLYDAGIGRDDVIVELGGQPVVDAEAVAAVVARHQPGASLPVAFRQRGQMHTSTLDVIADPTLELRTFEETGRTVTPEIEAFRRAWLGTKAGRE